MPFHESEADPPVRPLTMHRLLWVPSAAFLAFGLGWALIDRLIPRLKRRAS